MKGISDMILVVNIIIISMIGLAIASVLFLGNPIDSASQRGEIMTVEESKGIIFKTSNLKLKTGEHADAVEQFCLDKNDPNQEKLIRKARTISESGQRVEINYHQEFITSPNRCGKDKRIVDEIVRIGEK